MNKHKYPDATIPRSEHCISTVDISEHALAILNRLNSAGYKACLVGGSVRDLLLRHTPKDFDIATSAHPHEIKKLFRNCRLIGRRFQLAHIYFGREIIEVATFRGTTHDESNVSRRIGETGLILRDNVFGEINQDAWRRDFTINALYYDIADKSVLDFIGGMADLKAGLIRLIGDPFARYQEDPVRMLRAIRFAAKLNFKLSPETQKPIYSLASSLNLISPNRLFEEVVKLYQGGHASTVHQQLCEFALFPHLFPQTAALLMPNTGQPHIACTQLVAATLTNTDARIHAEKPVTPAFLLAAFLWYPLQEKIAELHTNDKPDMETLDDAMEAVIRTQIKSVSIPRRLTEIIREIWSLQYRFPRLEGKRPIRLLHHPRFRAAYDLLVLRAKTGEVEQSLADWWTNFQEMDPEQRELHLEQ